MQTKKDLLQAHRLMTQRASQALILGEPDNPEQPLKRLNAATFAGVMVGVLVAAGFGIAGIFLGQGTRGLTDGGLLLIEKETGARYIWCQPEGAKDKLLCPVANYASAKLALSGQSNSGGSGPKQKSVSAKSLTKFPRGPRIGIADAPDTIPDKKRLRGGPWSVCVRQIGASGAQRSVVTLVGGTSVGGQTLDAGTGVVVSDGSRPWLIWRNQRLLISPAGQTVLNVSNPPTVEGRFLNALPEGPQFAAPPLGGTPGTQVSAPGGAKGPLGQVYKVSDGVGNGDQFYVLRQDGYDAISPVQAALIRATKGYNLQDAQSLQPNAVTGNLGKSLKDERMPQTRIAAQSFDGSQSLCVVYPDASNGAQTPSIAVGGGKDLPVPGSPSQTGVDNVVLPPGSAVLAGSLGTSTDAISTYFFISDNGRKYPLKSAETAKAFGYTISKDSNDSVPVPASLLSLIPTGSTLDPAKAQLPVSSGAG
ncbi:type VII secretion protein EccB [Actinomadura barringtoniae]|uniref:Type VII secretion protein EccB n=1 Tax=Actinomadura barringtoniae TaxID=1427535 RepID=A0A939T8M9_9ACTN|nr:type VII secretion protein EccB [Actinomadura barringtoniae]MBO2454313.1 type VII secretion protein EccB [Actinomadura barringtoniae]